MAVKNLWVVMPVYNEEEAVSAVIEEWQKCLSENVEQFTFCIINDGSKDGTLGILRKYEARYKEIKIIDKPNSGHGQTCIYGYQLALDNGAEWIFQ
ncbi:MAG: glycosyltransferase, partial [Chitinophagaceae bacterium]|nr:glycosyltransferase [Chitinophagaceae bacterium]